MTEDQPICVIFDNDGGAVIEEFKKPQNQRRWIVYIRRVEEAIHIYPAKGFSASPNDIYVAAPNPIERILGITFQDKIDKAKKKCQAWCDKKNALEDEARKYAP